MKTSGDFYRKWLIVRHNCDLETHGIWGSVWFAYNDGRKLQAFTRAKIKQKIDRHERTA